MTILVTADIFYLALFPENKKKYFHQAFFASLEKPLPASRSHKKYEHAIKVFDDGGTDNAPQSRKQDKRFNRHG